MRSTVAPSDDESPIDSDLLEAARAVRKRAYAPYSAFPVGAALRTRGGQIFTGCNVENGSYGLTVCAERNSVFAAVASEGPSMRVQAMVISSDALSCPPCGACRQVLAEFGRDARVAFPHDGHLVTMTVDELLPIGFQLKPESQRGRQDLRVGRAGTESS